MAKLISRYNSSNIDVYDISVQNNHNFFANGVLVHNCMPSYSLCCLGAINLVKFVKNAFTDNAKFDYRDFEKTIKIGVRFLDDVLDVTDYPLDKIEKFSKKWRRIGLGFTGLGDALAMMRVKYGSPESLEICEKIAKTLRDGSYMASTDLAEEKGSFPSFDADKILAAAFVQKLPKEIKDRIATVGLRNIALNTVAPTGTISLSVGNNCSSGIEPMFSLQYDRNIRTGNGDETKKETVFDFAWLKYQEWARNNNIDASVKIPEYFVTSQEVDPYEGINVQAVFQEHIDHSISKTANLPTDYDFEKYSNLFMYAYKKGLKGFTSFNQNGCCSPGTKIITKDGVKTFGDIFEENEIDIYESDVRGWHSLKNNIEIFDENGDIRKINKLFVKGLSSNMVNITLEDGETLCLSPEHKVRINGEWIEIKNIKEGDELDVYQGDFCKS